MCFGAMRGYQEQSREARGPKRIISGRLSQAVTFGIRAGFIGCLVVLTGSSSFLRGWIVISHIGG
jgi:hypothetical protein